MNNKSLVIVVKAEDFRAETLHVNSFCKVTKKM